MRRFWKKQLVVGQTPSEPDYSRLRQGHFALLTVDLEKHPDYDTVPVIFCVGDYFHDLLMVEEVEFNVDKRGASGFGVFDDETGALAYHQRMSILPSGAFGWYHSATMERQLIQDQRDNPNIL